MLLGLMSQYFFGVTIFVLSIFLVLLVLVQRGRGGGIAGALGGPGGQSAFGTKAGDVFTRITIGVAAAWIFLCATSVYFLKVKKLSTNNNRAAVSATIGGDETGVDGTDSGLGSGTTDIGEGNEAATLETPPSEAGSADESNASTGSDEDATTSENNN